jgi:quercetin dioxygenase-like cupin family protein
MAIVRRADQVLSDRYPGIRRYAMTGASTGSTMLHVGDLTYAPGAVVPYHQHPATEETQFMVEGELEAWVDGKRFTARAGDCILSPAGVPHGFVNRSSKPARQITIFPMINPVTVDLMDQKSEPKLTDGVPDKIVALRADMKPYEFRPGITRYDMVGDYRGAKSTYFGELVFEPGAVAPNHFHPAHEESMFCLRGSLNAVYGENNDIPLAANDMFMCEKAVRHGIFNGSKSQASLLAIHPVLNPPPRIDVP